MRTIIKYTSLWIILLGAVLLLPFLGRVHLFDWDEVNFAECAREMLITKNYLIVQMNYLPFWEKPPLFIWLSALSMNFFGVNEMAARLPNAICGIITLLTIYHIGKKHFSRRIGLLWALCFAGSILPLFYFKSGIIDPWFNLFNFLAIYYCILFTYEHRNKIAGGTIHLLLCGVFVGLAILTKGPAAAIIFFIAFAVFFIHQRFQNVINLSQFLLLSVVILLIGGLWFIFLFFTGQYSIIENFVSYQVHLFQTEDSGHGGPFIYHFIVLLFGCFPASTFALRGFGVKQSNPFQKHFKLWLSILFWVVLLLFSLVKTKIIHYSSLCYFPLTFLAASAIDMIIKDSTKWKLWMNISISITGGLFALLLALLPLVHFYKDELIASQIINDQFTIANLKADVGWTGLESMIGVILLTAIVLCFWLRKRGRTLSAILSLFIGNVVAVELFCLIIIPKIELYSQNASIEFFEKHNSGQVYVCALGYHSYAQYYYSARRPEKTVEKNSNDWMLRGKIDKPAFFVAKISNSAEHAAENPQLKNIGEKNGFVFFMRNPQLEIKSPDQQ